MDKTDYERIGQDLELIIAHGYAGKRRMLAANFLRGLFFGLGTTVGVGLIVGLTAYILTLTQNVPFLRRISENLQTTLEQRR